MASADESYQVSKHTRARNHLIECAYCHEKDARALSDGWYGTNRLHCGHCKRLACDPCSELTWVHNAGRCILCVRKAAGLDEYDSSQDDALLTKIPCAHINQATYGGCTVWRCHDCGAGGRFDCKHERLSEPNFLGSRACLDCNSNRRAK